MHAQTGSRCAQAAAPPAATPRTAARTPFLPSRRTQGKTAERISVRQARSLVVAQSGMERVVTAAATGNGSGGEGSSSNRLLIVGPGVLGSYLGKLWVDSNGAGSAVGQTNSTNNHAK